MRRNQRWKVGKLVRTKSRRIRKSDRSMSKRLRHRTWKTDLWRRMRSQIRCRKRNGSRDCIRQRRVGVARRNIKIKAVNDVWANPQNRRKDIYIPPEELPQLKNLPHIGLRKAGYTKECSFRSCMNIHPPQIIIIGGSCHRQNDITKSRRQSKRYRLKQTQSARKHSKVMSKKQASVTTT